MNDNFETLQFESAREFLDAIRRPECSLSSSDPEADARIAFEFQSYQELWNEWDEHDALNPHVLNLRRRYEETV